MCFSLNLAFKITDQTNYTEYKTRKPCYRKENRAMRPVYGCPEKFRESLAMPMATFPEIVNGLLL